MSTRLPHVVVVGPLAPPPTGMTSATAAVLGPHLRRSFRLTHVDTSDHRRLGAIGRTDVRNVALGLLHLLRLGFVLLRRPQLVYVPIARSRLPFLRDAAFLLLARAVKVPAVVHLHARGFAGFLAAEPALVRLVARMALPRGTHAVVLGESRRHEFDPYVPADRVHVVPNGSPDGFPRGLEGPRPRAVVHLATLWSEKGVFDVLEAARRLAPVHPEVTFVLAGDWYREVERQAAEDFVSVHGLGQRAVFTGSVEGDAKWSVLAGACAMAFPSRYATEGHPFVVLEGLCAGLPVVATPVGCLPETITDGVEGFLVREGDVDALTERLSLLLADEAVRARMASAARARFESAFGLDVFAQRLGAAWSAAIDERRGRRAGAVQEATI